jgi:hypothetical protein
MPSPDVRGYLDLTVDDRDPQDLLRSALLNYATWLPDIDLQEGHTEAVLLESFAVLIGELVFRLNRLPAGMTELLLRLFGLTRDVGAQPTTTLTFASNGAFHVDAPPGTRARLELPGGLEPVTFATTAALTIPGGVYSTTVAAVGDRYTAEANGLPAGTALTPLDSIPGIDTVTLASPVAGGVDPEDGQAFLDRGVAVFRGLSSVLVRPDQFTARTVLDPRYPRATTLDNYDPLQAGDPGDHPGHVTVAVLGLEGALVPLDQRQALANALTAASQANLAVHVIDPTITDVDVAATVRGRPGYTPEQVEASVTAAVEAALDPLGWPFEPTVYRFSVVAAADAADGVARVEQVLLDGVEDDITLPGVAPLARAGTVAVTVNQ